MGIYSDGQYSGLPNGKRDGEYSWDYMGYKANVFRM